MLAGIRISIFRECEYLHVEGFWRQGRGWDSWITCSRNHYSAWAGSDRIPETPLLPGVSGGCKLERQHKHPYQE